MADWFYVTSQFQASYAKNATSTFNYTTAKEQFDLVYPNGTGPELSAVPYTTDDCLFLDVIVPEKIFNNANSSRAPVLVW